MIISIEHLDVEAPYKLEFDKIFLKDLFLNFYLCNRGGFEWEIWSLMSLINVVIDVINFIIINDITNDKDRQMSSFL